MKTKTLSILLFTIVSMIFVGLGCLDKVDYDIEEVLESESTTGDHDGDVCPECSIVHEDEHEHDHDEDVCPECDIVHEDEHEHDHDEDIFPECDIVHEDDDEHEDGIADPEKVDLSTVELHQHDQGVENHGTEWFFNQPWHSSFIWGKMLLNSVILLVLGVIVLFASRYAARRRR